MARCFDAKKSKAGKEIKCGRCDAPILPGEQYFYFSVGFRGSKKIRCKLHHPKQSELTGSKMSGAYAANEGIEAELNDPKATISSIATALKIAASDIESVRDEYQESYDNLPENFQNGDRGSEIQEKIDSLDAYAQSLNDKASEVRNLESSQDDSDTDPEANPEADPNGNEDLLQQAKDLAEEVLGEFEL